MKVEVRLAEPFWRSVGVRDLHLELDDHTSVADLMVNLTKTYPDLAREFEQSEPLIFLGDDEAEPQSQLENGQVVHLVWPLAGG